MSSVQGIVSQISGVKTPSGSTHYNQVTTALNPAQNLQFADNGTISDNAVTRVRTITYTTKQGTAANSKTFSNSQQNGYDASLLPHVHVVVKNGTSVQGTGDIDHSEMS